MQIIGIDPGKHGAIVYITKHEDTVSISSKVFPLIANEFDWRAFADLLRNQPPGTHVYIEHVHAMHGCAAGATFSFGGAFHGAVATVCALGLPHTLVQPKVWQKIAYQGINEIRKPDIKIKVGKRAGSYIKGRLDTKAMSEIAAKRLYPHVDLRKSPRCTMSHDGIVDALLIADYGARQQ